MDLILEHPSTERWDVAHPIIVMIAIVVLRLFVGYMRQWREAREAS